MAQRLKRRGWKPSAKSQFKFSGQRSVSFDSSDDDRLKREWLKHHEPTKLPSGWSRMGFAPVGG